MAERNGYSDARSKTVLLQEVYSQILKNAQQQYIAAERALDEAMADQSGGRTLLSTQLERLQHEKDEARRKMNTLHGMVLFLGMCIEWLQNPAYEPRDDVLLRLIREAVGVWGLSISDE